MNAVSNIKVVEDFRCYLVILVDYFFPFQDGGWNANVEIAKYISP